MLFIGAVVVAAFIAVGGVLSAWDVLNFPTDLARHSVPGNAVVTDSFINGFGGDPAVDYTYTVHGRSYGGWGEHVPGNPDLLSVTPGRIIPIEYASSNPAHSCTCDAGKEPYGWSPAAEDALAALPFFALLLVILRPRWRRRWLGTERAVAGRYPAAS